MPAEERAPSHEQEMLQQAGRAALDAYQRLRASGQPTKAGIGFEEWITEASSFYVAKEGDQITEIITSFTNEEGLHEGARVYYRDGQPTRPLSWREERGTHILRPTNKPLSANNVDLEHLSAVFGHFAPQTAPESTN